MAASDADQRTYDQTRQSQFECKIRLSRVSNDQMDSPLVKRRLEHGPAALPPAFDDLALLVLLP